MASTSEIKSNGIQILTIPHAHVTQRYDGENVELASGTLQVLLVSIELERAAQDARHFSSSSSTEQDYSTDLWLVLAIGEEFSLPVPANQIIRPQRSQGINSYHLPSLEIEGASINLALPQDASQEEVERFERILAQYSAYQDDDRSDNGKIELVDEEGQVLGTLSGNFNMRETDSLSDSGREKDPVLIDLPPEPVNENEKQDLDVDVLTAEEKSHWMIKGADMISRAIIKSSQFVGDKIQGAADSYVAKSPAAGSGAATPVGEKAEASSPIGREPVKVGPKTQSGVRTLHQWSGTAVEVSAKTTGAILQVAGSIGDKIGKKTGIQRKVNPDGTQGPAPKGIKGFINRSLIAANTVLDGVDAGAQTLLYTSGDAAGKVVGHRFGEDAKQLAEGVGRTGKNVFIVYKDVRGVRRSALLKAARSRVMKAQLKDGSEVLVKIDEEGKAVASPISSAGASASTSTSSKSATTSARTETTQMDASANSSSYPVSYPTYASQKDKRFVAGEPVPHAASDASSIASSGYATPPSYSSATESSSSAQNLPPPPTHPSVRRTPSPQLKR